MLKQEIRSSMKELKSGLRKTEIEEFSNRIIDRVIRSAEYRECGRIFSYVSFNQEVMTTGLIQTALKAGKWVAVPKIEDGIMKFYYINSLSALRPGVLGISEPYGGEEAVPPLTEPTLIIVPGLAFDRNKNRLGYGKGYYDSFFIKYSGYPLRKIGLAYDFQVLKELPAEIHDIKVDRIITRSGIIQ